MNATAGKINVNASIYPNGGRFAPPKRLVPLQALFTNTPASAGVAQNIVNHTLAAGGSTYAGDGKFYNYPGEICEIKGVADSGATDWDKEATIRNLASTLTTKSNVFSVWGVAQTVKKLSAHKDYGSYEPGDVVTGEKRFQAIVERYVWPGADGVVGNGHTGSGGTYDSVTQGATQPGYAPVPPASTTNTAYNWEKLDGPDKPTYPPAEFANTTINPYNAKVPSNYSGTPSDPLEIANNPVRALMKYRVIYFRYLD